MQAKKLAHMQLRPPPTNVMVLPYTPDIFTVTPSAWPFRQRSGLNSSASGPQITLLWFAAAIAMITSVPFGTGIESIRRPSVPVIGVERGRVQSSVTLESFLGCANVRAACGKDVLSGHCRDGRVSGTIRFTTSKVDHKKKHEQPQSLADDRVEVG